MNSINYLAEIMTAEAELTEQLVEVMRNQQAALVKIDPLAVERATDRQQELLLPIEGLEQERVRLTREVWSQCAQQVIDESASVNLASLIKFMEREDAGRITAVGSRLHNAVEQMVKLNQANQYLIEHSRKLVHETFKIVTNGFSRQLVDQRI
jgi:flagellar biosynthesis/type III secretory pathway chaperone